MPQSQPQPKTSSGSPWWEKGLSIPLLYEQGLGSLPANGYRGDIKTWGKSSGEIPMGSMAPLPAPGTTAAPTSGASGAPPAPIQVSLGTMLERYGLISPSKNDRDGTDGHAGVQAGGDVSLPDGFGRTASGVAGGIMGLLTGNPLAAFAGYRGGTGIYDYFNGSDSSDDSDPTGGLSDRDHTGGMGGGYGGMGGDYGVGGMRRGGRVPRPRKRARKAMMPIPSPRGFRGGGRIVGPGTGRSDSVPAVLDGIAPVEVSSDEYVFPADVVAALGDGSSDAGARKLDAMVMKTRRAYAKKLAGLPAPRKSRGSKFLGGLFDGGGDSKTEVKQELPDYLKQLQSIFSPMVGTALSQEPKDTVAGFSPDQVASYNALRELATKDPTGYFKQMADAAGLASGSTANTKAATGIARSALVNPASIGRDSRADAAIRTLLNPDKYSTGAIKGMMNPYDALVTNRTLKEFDRAGAIETAGAERDRASRRAFGTRASLAEAEDRRNLGTRRDNLTADLNQAGFDKAVAQFNTGNATKQAGAQGALAGVGQEYGRLRDNQQNRFAVGQNRLAVANTLGDLGSQGANTNLDIARFLSGNAGDVRNTGIGNAQLLSGVGGAYQNQQQRMLDAPWGQVNRLNSIFSGAPMNTTQTGSGGGSSPFSQMAGLGLLGAGLFFKNGGKLPRPKGYKRGGCLPKPRGYADGGRVQIADHLLQAIEAGEIDVIQARDAYRQITDRDLFADFPTRFGAEGQPLPIPGATPPGVEGEVPPRPVHPTAEGRLPPPPSASVYEKSMADPVPQWMRDAGSAVSDMAGRAVRAGQGIDERARAEMDAAVGGQRRSIAGGGPLPAPTALTAPDDPAMAMAPPPAAPQIPLSYPTATGPLPPPLGTPATVAAMPAPPGPAKPPARTRPLDEVRQMIRNPGAIRASAAPMPVPRPYPAGASASPLPPPGVTGGSGDDVFVEDAGDTETAAAQPGRLESFLSNPLTIAGLHMLSSRNPSAMGALGEAGIGLVDYTMKRRADERAAVREARADRREERIETRDQARIERETARDAVKDAQWAAEMSDKQLDREAKRAYEAARLGQFAQAISIRERNLARLVSGGARPKADIFDRKIKENMADAIAEATVSGDAEEAQRLMSVYATMMAGDELTAPEGFVAGDDL